MPITSPTGSERQVANGTIAAAAVIIPTATTPRSGA